LAFVLNGGGSAERERVVKRMCELGEQLGEGDHLLRAQIALSNVFLNQSEAARGLELARRCVELAESNSVLLVDARVVAGLLAEFSGNLREAISDFELAGRASLPLGPDVQGGLMYSVLVPSNLALAQQLVGRVGEAARVAEEGLKRARESNHPFSLS